MLSIPAAPLKPDPAQIRRAQPTLRFDQSLEQLEHSWVITWQERCGLEAGQLLAPIDVSRHQRACRDGALSNQECAAGLAVRTVPRFWTAPAKGATPNVFAVSPRPSPCRGMV